MCIQTGQLVPLRRGEALQDTHGVGGAEGRADEPAAEGQHGGAAQAETNLPHSVKAPGDPTLAP